MFYHGLKWNANVLMHFKMAAFQMLKEFSYSDLSGEKEHHAH